MIIDWLSALLGCLLGLALGFGFGIGYTLRTLERDMAASRAPRELGEE